MTVLRRTTASVTALVALVAAFAVGLSVAGRGAADDGTVRPAAGLDAGRSCDDLLAWYVDRAVDRVTPWGWTNPMIYAAEGVAPVPDRDGVVAEPAAAAAPGTTRTTSSTGTNVQEAGVDEPDLAKAAGGLLVRIDGDHLEIWDVTGSVPHLTGSAPLTGLAGAQLLLAGDRVVVIGDVAKTVRPDLPTGPLAEQTVVRTFDVSDPAHPAQVDSRVYDGRLVIARQSGDTVRLVLTTALPQLAFVTPDAGRSQDQALVANRAIIRHSTLADWLPNVTANDGAPHALLDCSKVAVPDTDGGLGTLAVVGFSATAPAAVSATAVATASTVAYMSPDRLYVATTPGVTEWGCCRPLPQSGTGADPDRTQLYAFDLAGPAATYAGSASVAGRVADGWSMDEYDGVLRVAVGPTQPGGTSSVVTLRPEAGHLAELGRLDGLGHDGDAIQSVRWLDGLAVLVTYRQLDPFYALDLSDPAHPRELGALELPGYSSYLHPVGDGLVLGLGQAGGSLTPVDAPPVPTPAEPMPPEPMSSASAIPRDPQLSPPSGAQVGSASASVSGPIASPPHVGPITGGERFVADRAKATLFDIADPAHPTALDTVSYPRGSVALAGVEPHQVTWLPDRHTLLTVIGSTYGAPGAWVAELRVTDTGLEDRRVDLGPLPDLASIRTVPLADGRVVLVQSDDVRFLPL